MTAVAWRDGVMCADSAIWGGSGSNTIVGHRKKIRRLPDGGLFAGCGRSTDVERIGEHLAKTGGFSGLSRLEDEQFGAIWAKPDGTVWWVENDFHPLPVEAAFTCCGSAEVFMLGALYADASAERAVSLAIQHTDGAGGEVQIERLHPEVH